MTKALIRAQELPSGLFNAIKSTRKIKKRVVFAPLFFVALLSSSLTSTQSVSAYSGLGEGSEVNPYRILNCTQLQEMADDLTAHYALYANINCSETSTWNNGAGFVPVGDCWGPGFAGSLDGRGHVISNLFINRPTTDRQALFGCTNNGASIRNVGMQNVDITGMRYAGGIVGVLVGSTISNSYVTGEVKLVYGEVMGSGQFAGGIAAGLENAANIDNSYSTADVSTYYHDMWGEGGIAGYSYGDSTVTDSFWNSETPSTVLISEGGGTAKTALEMRAGATFTGAGWDFEGIWNIDGDLNDGYPILIQEGMAVNPLCEEIQVTATTIRAACQLQYSGEPDPGEVGETTWSARYRAVGELDWIYVDIADPSTGEVVFTSLSPATDYEVSLKPTNNLFDDWATMEATTLSEDSDSDLDGSLDISENGGPNNGDANDDGTLDSLQANVLSYINPLTNQPAVLEAVNCTSITGFQVGAEASEPADGGFDYPMGLSSFHILCPNDGDTATIRQYYYGVEGNSSYSLRKWMSDGSYREIPVYSLLGIPINGHGVVFFIEYEITDGGEFDDDGTLNGIIVDPSGPALAAVSTASDQSSQDLADTGQSTLILSAFSAILLLTSIAIIRTRAFQNV